MTDKASLLKQLSALSLCRGLNPSQVDEIFQICREAEVDAGTVLFREGDDGDALYTVLEGEVEVAKADGNGGSQVLAKVDGGAVLGEMSLFGPHQRRSATATAVSKVRLLKIGVDHLNALIAKDNVAALKVVHNMAQVMSKRLLLMNDKLVKASSGNRKEELLDFQKILNEWAF